MRCPSCQTDNDERMKFCTNCGASLGGRRCAQGHSIPDGLAECPYCPRPVRSATVAESPEALSGGRKATSVVSPTDLARSGVQPLQSAPGVPSMGSMGAGAAPAGRGRTVFRGPNDPDEPTAPPGAALGGSAQVAPLAGFLVTFSQTSSGQFWPIRFGRTSIGSDAGCDVQLGVAGVSGRHAEVMVRDNDGKPKIWLSDSNSTNGTRLNGADIFTDRPDLSHGDVVSISGIELTVVFLPSYAGPR